MGACQKKKRLLFAVVISVALGLISTTNVFSFTPIVPASATMVGAGGQMSVTSINASTGTSIGATNVAPNISYNINASGNGFIEASMAAQIQESFGAVGWAPMPLPAAPVFTFDTAGLGQAQIDAAGLDPANYFFPAISVAAPLVRFERFEQTSSASGNWTFSKEMAYGSQLP
jgi:hypothetical protein